MKQNQLLISGEIAAAAVIILIMSYFCRTSDSDALKWILAPTAWWAGILGGIYFEYLPRQLFSPVSDCAVLRGKPFHAAHVSDAGIFLPIIGLFMWE